MSTVSNPCYEHIIGISRTDCECFDFTDDDQISDSGLYLLELEPLNASWVQGREDCEKGTLAEIARNAREQAVTLTKNAILNEILKYNEYQRQPFTGGIGKFNYSGNRTINQTYRGLKIFCADIIGGVLKIKNIRTVFSTTDSFDILLYNNLGELIGTYPVNSIADQMEPNTVDIELPMHSEYIDNLEYTLIYSGMTPKNISLVNCSAWSYDEPCCNQLGYKDWQDWVMVSGWTGDSLNFIDCHVPFLGSYYTNGLILDVELSCKCEEVICKDAFDFVGNPLAMNFALAVQLMGNINLIKSILGDTEISRLVLTARDTLVAFMNDFTKQWKDLIEKMGKNINIKLNDCYQCKDFYNITKSGIFT